jgi:hypothetical protein
MGGVTMKRSRLTAVLVMIVLLSLSQSVFGQHKSIEDKTFDVGVSVGSWFSGDVSVTGGTVEKDGSMLIRVFGDAYLIPQLGVGAYFNYSPISQDDIDVNVLEFGAALKPRFFLSPEVAIKPGLSIGYRLGSSDIEVVDHDGLGLNVSVELQYFLEPVLLFGEIGFLSQPAGGNDFIDVTYSPIFYLSGGIGL